jgi:ankyrin repeat protein
MEFFFDEQPQQQQRTNRLFVAASKGDAERFSELLDTEDASVVVNGLNCLHIASKKNHHGIVNILIQKDPSCINVMSADDKTALMLAAAEGSTDVVRVLAAAAAAADSTEFINFQNAAGNSALHYGVWNGHEECSKYLVENCNADPMLKNKDGMTAIQFASAANHASLVDYLSSFGSDAIDSMSASGLNNLHRACMHGALDTVVALVSKQHMDPSTHALVTGNTAIHLAAKGGYNDIVRFLLDQPATNKNAQNKHGLTPLHFACNG